MRFSLPFADGKWRMNMGLKALNLQEWIDIDQHFAEELALKDQLLKNQYSEVFSSLPNSQFGQQEVLDLLIAHLLNYFPQYYQQQGEIIANLCTGQTWHLADFDAAPLDLAGRLVQEDLLLMQQTANGYILAAAALCFPLRWRLSEKIGRPLSQIHAPVPGYQDKLASPVNHLFEHLQFEHPSWRLNWSIVETPQLFLLPSTTADLETTINSENAGEKLWIRVERQTIRRLQKSQDILFTTHSYVYPLNSLEADPSMAANLAQAIQQIPLEMQSYKNILPIRPALLGYLNQLSEIIGD
jgi:dimethylamine monooxygenase subunit A